MELPEPRLSQQLQLDELWDALSVCLTSLAKMPDSHAVLVLQPTVEAFFLVHAGLCSRLFCVKTFSYLRSVLLGSGLACVCVCVLLFFSYPGHFVCLCLRVSSVLSLNICLHCLVVSTSAVDCLEGLAFEMTCYVSSGMLNSFPNI